MGDYGISAGKRPKVCTSQKEKEHRHFMTKRFDRLDDGDKLHMQSLGVLAH